MNVGDGACAAQIGKASASQIRHTATGAQRSVLVLASSIVVAFLAAANGPSPLWVPVVLGKLWSDIPALMPGIGRGEL